MRIDKVHPEIVRNDANAEVQGVSDADAVKQAAAPSEAPRADSVQISDAGRALAEGAHGPDGDSLSAEELNELRQLVVGGKYDNPEVIAEVARRMSASGDLRSELSE